MDCRVLVRFIGEGADLALLWQAFMEKFPEAELPSEDSGDWYSVVGLPIHAFRILLKEGFGIEIKDLD